MEIKNIKLFPNLEPQSMKMKEIVEKKLPRFGYNIVEEDYQLAIAIGGDGSLLHMARDNQFNSDIYYVGINTGTLGFLQEISPEKVDDFLIKLKEGEYKIEQIGIQETDIITNHQHDSFYTLNDIAIYEYQHRKMPMDVYIDNELLENYIGDGLIIATSIGSTAHNLNYGGSIVYGDLHTLQITPIGPFCVGEHRVLPTSVIIPETKTIKLCPNPNSCNLNIHLDSEQRNYEDVIEINTTVSKKRIKRLRMQDNNSTKIIHDKFLK